VNFGQRLYSFTDGKSHVKPEQNFGFAVASADVNGDGKADIIRGAYRGQTGPLRTDPTTGYIRVYNGADGSLLYQLNGEASGEEFGRYLAAGGPTGGGEGGARGGPGGPPGGGGGRCSRPGRAHRSPGRPPTRTFEWLGSSVAITDGGA